MAERRESVRLELHDQGFSTGMVKNAAATGLLEKALKSLDGTNVVVHERISQTTTGVDGLSNSSRDADGSINQLTGRLRVLGEVAAILAPSLAPVGGVLTAGVAGLASQMGFAAVAGGVLIGSMQGLGDALGAMNTAQLDPSVKNIAKAEAALKRLSPAAQEFADQAFALKPALVALRDIGSEALFPGLTESLDSIEELGPRVGAIMESLAGTLGDIASDSAASLASERWQGFFEFIAREAPQTIKELAATVGDLTHGLAELWEAFTPLNDDFSSWLMDAADGFDRWATGLSATEGFSEFIDYVRTTGPQVADTFAAIANAVLQIVEASAPLGGPVLAGIEAVAKVIGAIADSDLGTPIMAGVTALALLNRTLAVTAALSKTSLSTGLFSGVGTLMGKGPSGPGSPLFQLQAMPGAIKAATAAQDGLIAAQKRASSVTATYVGQLQAVNSATSRGFKPSMQTLDRLTDSLDQVEAANRDVATATARATEAEGKRRGIMKASAGEIGKAAGVVGGLALVSSGAADSIGLTNTASLALMGSMAGPWGIAVGAGVGALMDFRAAGEQATEAIAGLDAAIQSGDPAVLTEQIAAAKAQLADFKLDDMNVLGDWAGNVVGVDSDIDTKTAQIEAAEKALKELTKAEAEREAVSRRAALTYASEAGLNANLSVWRRKSVEEIKAQADALKAVDDAARSTAQSFLGFGDSLNDSKVSLSDFIADMQKSADALRNFNSNSLKAAKKGLDEGLIASLREAGTEGALRMKQLANATESEIARANRAHRSQTKALEQTEDVARRLAGMSPVVKVKAETAGAMNDIAGLEARLRAIKDESVNVVVRTINTGDTQFGPRGGVADGGTIPGQRYPYGDKHLYMLAPGEEVITNRNGQADKHRSLLKQINAGALADGGTAGDDKKKRRKPQVGAAYYVDDNTKALQSSIDYLATVAADQTKALERSTKTTEEWASKMADVASATTSGFDTGLFAKDSNPWASGAGGGWMANLTRDIGGLEERGALQSQLAGAGLSGDALAALLAQGSNADLTALVQSGQAQQYAALFNQRAALQGSVGAAGGQLAYGAEYSSAQRAEANAAKTLAATQQHYAKLESQLAKNTAALERMEANAPERTGAAVGAAINGSASKAHRDKKNGR